MSATFLGSSLDPSRRAVAAVYGWDLQCGHPDLDLTRLVSDGFEILALDRPAIAALLHHRLPFRTPEDWLASADIDPMSSYSDAASASAGWSGHDPGGLTSDGLRWPDHDHWCVPETWLTMTIGFRLACVFQRVGVTRLRFSSQHPQTPQGVRESPLSPLADLWHRMLPDVADPVSVARIGEQRSSIRIRRAISATPLGGPLRATRSLVATRRLSSAADSLLNGVDRSNLVLLMLPARELDRSAPIIARLRKHLGPALIAVPWMDNSELTSEAGGLNALPWLPTPPLERGFLRDERRLASGVDRNLAAHDLGEFESARPEIGSALRMLAHGWASHARRLRWTVAMLRQVRPRLVISARDAIGYQIPTEAARLAAVPVITLPHGVVEWSPPERLEVRTEIVHVGGIRNPTSRTNAITVCQDLIIEHEYPRRVREFSSSAERTTMQVLVITEGYLGWNSPSVLARSHQRALQIVAAAARTRADVRFLLKPHPGDPDDEGGLMREDLHDECSVSVLPRETDVIAAIAASDLVVGLNYIGSAMVHAVLQGRPAVRITTSSTLLHAEGEMWANWTAWAAFWDRMLLSVEDADGLVEVLRRMKDPAFVEELRRRSHAAAAALRPDADAPSIIDVVDEILAARTGQNS